MNNTSTIVILGLYTLVYVIVFIIQKSQIDKQKTIIDSMKTFIEIFKVDEVKKYVEMKHETMTLKVENHLEKLAKDFAKNSEQTIRNMVEKDLNDGVEEFKLKYNEAWNGVFEFIILLPKDIRIEFVKENFPYNSATLIKELENYNEDTDV